MFKLFVTLCNAGVQEDVGANVGTRAVHQHWHREPDQDGDI